MELTPEQIAEQTCKQIEKAVEDVKKNLASRAEVVQLIDEKVAADKPAMEAAQKKLEEAQSRIDETAATVKDLQAQIRRRTLEVGGESNLTYRGIYSSRQEARAVGLAILACGLHPFRSEQKARYDTILKAFEDCGFEMPWIDDSGRKAATTTGQTTGSVLVGDSTPGILMLMDRYGRARANAQRVPLAAVATPTPKITDLLTVYVQGEGAAPSLSDLIAGMITLTPKTMTVLAAYSIELDEDAAVGLAELYGDLIARSLAYYEDLCAFLGDGTSTYFGYKGIMGALRAVDATIGNIKSLTVASGNAYSEIVLGDFQKVAGNLPEYADSEEAKWYCHKYFYWTVMLKLALAQSDLAAEILNQVGKRSRIYLGYPVEYVQVMPKAEANSQICALLANLRMGLQFGTRGGIEIAQSDQRYFDQGLIAIRGRSRVAINAHGVGDTAAPGPICGLITAAA